MTELDKKVMEYIAHCYRYYVLDEPTISDGEFDALARHLLENYGKITPRIRRLVSEDEYAAATYLGSYPFFIKDLL